jgi:hypothetical protein
MQVTLVTLPFLIREWLLFHCLASFSCPQDCCYASQLSVARWRQAAGLAVLGVQVLGAMHRLWGCDGSHACQRTATISMLLGERGTLGV